MSGHSPRRLRNLGLKVLVAIVAVGVSACGDAARNTQAVPPSEQSLMTSCGPVDIPGPDLLAFPREPLSAENQAALDSVLELGELETVIFAEVEWSLVSASRNELTFIGRGEEGHSYMKLARSGGEWRYTQAGTCSLTATAKGWSSVLWVLDPDVAPDSSSSELSILIVERECNSGQPPVGRDVETLVVPSPSQLRIHVFLEPRRTDLGFDQTCLSNPWYPVVIDLGEPLGDRTLLDGMEIPPIERSWPPTQSILRNFGRPGL